MKSNIRIYNVLLPVWLIIFIPSPLWLLLIPANYLLDRIVLRWSLGDLENKGTFCKKNNWKICLAGFASDFVGAIFLFAVNQIMYAIDGERDGILGQAADHIMYNPITNVLAFIIVAISIVLAAICIYTFDKRILTAAGIDAERAKKSAIRLALITAPYLYLLPSELFYY